MTGQQPPAIPTSPITTAILAIDLQVLDTLTDRLATTHDLPLLTMEATGPLGKSHLTIEPSHSRGLLHCIDRGLNKKSDDLGKNRDGRSTPDPLPTHHMSTLRRGPLWRLFDDKPMTS